MTQFPLSTPIKILINPAPRRGAMHSIRAGRIIKRRRDPAPHAASYAHRDAPAANNYARFAAGLVTLIEVIATISPTIRLIVRLRLDSHGESRREWKHTAGCSPASAFHHPLFHGNDATFPSFLRFASTPSAPPPLFPIALHLIVYLMTFPRIGSPDNTMTPLQT